MYIHNGKTFDKSEFETWIENQVFSELDKFISESDRLAVAASGGKDSTFMLDMTYKWSVKNKRSLPEVILIDEGIEGYREFTSQFLEKFCRERKLKLHKVSFKNTTGKTLDEILKIRNKKKLNEKYGSCTICGAFRRYLLNRKARELKATKLLVGHNLDDEVQTFLMNMFAGNVGQVSRKGELAGVVGSKDFVIRFKPLIWIPEKAITIYALFNYPEVPEHECPYLRESLRHDMRRMANELEQQWPGFKVNLMKTYVNKLLPELESVKKSKLKTCELCGEPSSQNQCKVCEFRDAFGLRNP